jgi:hypothetical protein
MAVFADGVVGLENNAISNGFRQWYGSENAIAKPKRYDSTKDICHEQTVFAKNTQTLQFCHRLATVSSS